MAILSDSPFRLNGEGLAAWRNLELQVMNQAGVRTEKFWFNFTPDRVHWARHAGRNHNTHRQTIKRRAESWARRYAQMPPGERLAALAGLMAVQSGEEPPTPSLVASVVRQSLREEFAVLKGRFAQLCAEGKITAESRAPTEALLLSVLTTIFMEKSTPKTRANSSTPSLRAENNDSALSHAGSHTKG